MRVALSRIEQVERNRERVLAAARRVFLERGYAGATLDAIAVEAGFSKGVVYSQFDSKTDLFLALLEHRINERADQNDRLAANFSGPTMIAAAIRLADDLDQAEPEWALLVIEFRAHAARDPELNQRYAQLHTVTVERLSQLLARLHERAGTEPPCPVRVLAELILAVGAGTALERVAVADALPAELLSRLIAHAITSPTA